MRTGKFFMVVFLGGSLAAAGCGSSRGEAPPVGYDALAPVSGPLMVAVANNNWQDMDIYAVHEGERFRLGTVTSMTQARFRLPAGSFPPGGNIVLVADPIGSPNAFSSGPILANPGQTISWNLENHLALSNYRVF